MKNEALMKYAENSLSWFSFLKKNPSLKKKKKKKPCVLSSLKADPSLYFKTLGDVFRMEVIPHSESTVFFVFFLLKGI